MKKVLLRTTVFLVTFFVTLVAASRILNKDHDNMTMEMAQATLPTVQMSCEGRAYNRLFGYTVPMDYPSQRDSITILGENRDVDLVIAPYGREVTAIRAQLRSTDGERLIETLELTGQGSGEEIQVSLELKDLIESGREYLLVIQLEMDGWQTVHFYTRAVWNADSHLAAELDFVQDFHDRLYQRAAAQELIKYLESNSKLESNSSFHKVNIHSSFKQITWGDMKVTETQAPVFTLKEKNSQSCTLVGDYQVAVREGNNQTDYRMREYFRVRYTADRMYLLAYERTMTQIPNDDRLYGGDKLLLGIGDENVQMMENENGSVVAFQQADCLYSYQNDTQKLAHIFQFYDADVTDVRNVHDEHDIRILNVDADGNVDFAVYGYMNRGEHEGEVGVRICRYDSNVNIVEERAFLPWNKPYSNLKAQLEQLFFLNESEEMYLFLDQAVYEIGLSGGYPVKLMEVKWDGCMQASEDHHILVWQDSQLGDHSSVIHIRDLRSGEQAEIHAESNESLKILGFMEQDLIFGVANTDQIQRESGGQLFFPMCRVCIAKADGTVVKEYAQENVYVISCEVEDNQIVLERLEQKEDGSFIDIPQDHITRTTVPPALRNQISLVDIDVYERYVQIQVSGRIESAAVQLLRPKEVVQEGRHDLELAATVPEECFSVYGPYGVEGIYLSAGNAVNKAAETAGAVISRQGSVVWQKGNLASRNQIMSIREPAQVPAQESLAACLDAMLAQQGITVDSAAALAEGEMPLQIMKNVTDMSPVDMTGCDMDAMLYFVNRDIPVLSILRDGEAVLITGFNETQVVIFQPGAGKLSKRSRSDAAKWFEQNGNCFLTFFLDF